MKCLLFMACLEPGTLMISGVRIHRRAGCGDGLGKARKGRGNVTGVKPPPDPRPGDPARVRDACEAMTRGGLGRRDFMQLAVQWGLSSTVAAAMAGLSAPTSLAAASRRPEQRRRPNIVLILADDMGFGDLGIMGS